MTGSPSTVRKILVADDDPGVRALLVKCLSPLKATIFQAPDGAAALETALREVPDLILLDNIMPNLTGTQVALRLREDARFCKIPMVMISSDPEPTPGPNSRLDVPFDGWISKPFNPTTLKDRLLKFASDKRPCQRPPEPIA